ncbi:hypothetical protein [Gulosibacter molinativorax]|uniref:Uncharacterized protein n=1 Tax=Gulosibacter molinativorax TaxID=256821 RepID=A0ABT7C608_9MICO|nr:hypothetical protein [Gulosibacter molinativorax]MDJ1370643.1 hypothetical protein [Gulosibacter molinativorax]QUY63333.1 Hypotetical protein [Gulosibacter molinativorax]
MTWIELVMIACAAFMLVCGVAYIVMTVRMSQARRTYEHLSEKYDMPKVYAKGYSQGWDDAVAMSRKHEHTVVVNHPTLSNDEIVKLVQRSVRRSWR